MKNHRLTGRITVEGGEGEGRERGGGSHSGGEKGGGGSGGDEKRN